METTHVPWQRIVACGALLRCVPRYNCYRREFLDC